VTPLLFTSKTHLIDTISNIKNFLLFHNSPG
jgi:hypothetical protein